MKRVNASGRATGTNGGDFVDERTLRETKFWGSRRCDLVAIGEGKELIGLADGSTRRADDFYYSVVYGVVGGTIKDSAKGG